MQNRESFRAPYVATGLCLLAFTAFPAGSFLARAQTPAVVNGNSASEGVVPLSGHTAREVLDGTAIRVAHYNPEQKLRLVLAVRPPHMAAEEQFLQELQTKGSPNFHQFLSPEQWNARFAPSVEDEQKVVDWAVSQGLTVTNRFANRLIVDVEAPAGVIEKAFSVTLNTYQVGDEVDFANDRDPLVPVSLAGIMFSVEGLNSIQRARRAASSGATPKYPDYVPGPAYAVGRSRQGEGDPTKRPASQTAASAQDGVSPQPDFTHGIADPFNIPFSSQSYNYNALYALGHCCNPHNDSTGSPPDSSIALVTAGDFADSDVHTFFQTFGMAYNYTVFSIDGTNPPGTECQCDYPAQDGEAPIDVEYSTATANSFGSPNTTAHVYVYEEANTLDVTYTDVFNFILSDNHAKVLSTSYGYAEDSYPQSFIDTNHGIFNQMVGQGWTLIAAAGDQGATDGCGNSDQVDYPSSDYDFVAAGGTSLSIYSNGNYDSETAWTGGTYDNSYALGCKNNNGGGGGGTSLIFPLPSWQNGLVSGATHRLVPDFSMNAGGVGQYVYIGGNYGGVGGTSVVAPELAGFFAQENAYLAYIGSICGSGTSVCEPIGNPSPVIYDEAKYRNAAHFPFYDITQLCNNNNITQEFGLPYYCAGTGYDQATGWGSINALQLAWAINWEIIPASGSPYVTFSGPVVNRWYNTNQTVNWTIHDYRPSGATPGTGIAGETQGWDSIPADPSSEATPGSGNSFYSGPEFPNGSVGCLAFEPNGCSGGVSQGCHTAYARGWNNQGFSTAGNSGYPESYGPLCYDTVAPALGVAITPSTPQNSPWYNKAPVTATLSATDPGGSGASGVQHIYYGYNSATCNIGVTSGCDFFPGGTLTYSTDGVYSLFAFVQDKAGNTSPLALNVIALDTTPPATATGISGTLSTGAQYYTSTVTVVLKATDNLSGVAHTYYSLDGEALQTYSAPFVIYYAGAHTLAVHSIDVAGNSEQVSTYDFSIVSPTATKLTLSSSESLFGQSVTLTAKVTPTLLGTPGGSIVFYNGTKSLGTATLSGGVASLTTAALPWGADSLTASYSGSSKFLSSVSSVAAEDVQRTTTTTIVSSLNPSYAGNSVTFTATVAAVLGQTPSGTVQFLDGTTVLGDVTLASGAAAYTTSALTAGLHSITAVYKGSSLFQGDTSSVLPQTVKDKIATNTTVATSPNPATLGQSVTMKATVSGASGATPTGTVSFRRGTIPISTSTLSGGVATFATTGLDVGNYDIIAIYNGSSVDAVSTSAAVVLKVDQ